MISNGNGIASPAPSGRWKCRRRCWRCRRSLRRSRYPRPWQNPHHTSRKHCREPRPSRGAVCLSVSICPASRAWAAQPAPTKPTAGQQSSQTRCFASCLLSRTTSRDQHDPEKWKPVFPRDKREAFARRSRSNKRMTLESDSSARTWRRPPCRDAIPLRSSVRFAHRAKMPAAAWPAANWDRRS